MHRPRRLIWLAPVCLNTVLGVVGIVPFFVLWYFVVSFPLRELGFTERDPTENDGVLPWVIILVLVEGVFLAIWFLANYLVRDGTPARLLPARRYWAVSVAALFAPLLVVVAFGAVRSGLGQGGRGGGGGRACGGPASVRGSRGRSLGRVRRGALPCGGCGGGGWR
ncbi:hypothetical protein [Streptomyces specialis]|uniref:hypothetical protein n=1 Tax=Streptomyces specialis TaxID=498367 RepID=UPI00073E3963|nr:hypothetical protein [Streptomyces specialis]